jgi:diaminopimelate epimerase
MTGLQDDGPRNENATIRFTKASGCGNDFLIIDGDGAHTPNNLADLTRRLCDRHNGIGADGVEWVFPDDQADVMARLINADGFEAEVSGNGTRCVAAEICSRSGKTEITIRTGAGLKTCQFLSRQGVTFEFEADMGNPEVGVELSFNLQEMQATGTKVSMGNPHFVIFVDQFPQAWQQDAAQIAKQPQFPQGTNIEYVIARGKNEIEIRLFERGVGETQSSGTGSCASAVAAIASGRASSPVTVIAPGGAQTVRWENHVYLQGPATILCRGEFFI